MQVVVATGLRSMTVKPSDTGAAIDDQTLGRQPLRITGGDEVSVSTSG